MQRVVRPQQTVSVITNSSSERVADSLFAFEKYSSAALTAPLSYSLIYKNTLEYYNVQFPSDRIYTVHPIFLKVSDYKRMPVGHVVTGIVVFKYYDLL